MGRKRAKKNKVKKPVFVRLRIILVYIALCCLFFVYGSFHEAPYFPYICAGLILMALLGIFFKPIRRLILRYRYLHSSLGKIDNMEGTEFEEYLAVAFEEAGYEVSKTVLSRDYGADLIIEKDGIRTAVQAKRYNDPVGIPAVQQAYTAAAFYDCDESMVVTNSYYTVPALELAEKTGTILWDRDDIREEFMQK